MNATSSFPPSTLLKRLRIAVALLGAVSACSAMSASCWTDPQVEESAHRIAVAGFPYAAAQMPRILVCEADMFGPNIGGYYRTPDHAIFIPVWRLGSQELEPTLAHELAHAEVQLTGGNPGEDGHGRDFIVALMRAGWSGEAYRVAAILPTASRALAEALDRGQGAVPQARRQVCEWTVQAQQCRLPNGWVVVLQRPARVCRQEGG